MPRRLNFSEIVLKTMFRIAQSRALSRGEVSNMWTMAAICTRRLSERVCGIAKNSHLRTFAANRNGATIITIALTLPALVGMMGLAVEISYWYWNQRAMQNATDAAAIAAATNASANYQNEAKGVGARYAFDISRLTATTAVGTPTANCPAPCNYYTVLLSSDVPLFLSQVVGYSGDGKGSTMLAAVSVARSETAYDYCVLALGSSGKEGIRSDGGSKADLSDCNAMSNTSATCNGSNLNAPIVNAAGNNKGCGINPGSNVAKVEDPYSCKSSASKWLASCADPPADTCKAGGGYPAYPQRPTKKGDKALPATNLWNGSYSFGGGYKVVCGDQQLTGNTTMNDGVLVIVNGVLDLNGFKLTGTNLTIVFTGSNDPSYSHIITGNGTLDIAAPKTGTWKGIAIFQDPKLTVGVDITYSGNNPTWDITGLVYLPHSSVTMSGAVGKSSSGESCFEIVVDNILLNGNANIFSNNTKANCAKAGLTRAAGGHRGVLVN